MVEKIDRIWHSKKWMSAFRLLMVSLMMSALSVTKLANRGSVEERVLNVVECAVCKRRTLRQLSGTINGGYWVMQMRQPPRAPLFWSCRGGPF